MRLWSLHPKYLDGKGLGGVWREALLAQTLLRGNKSSLYQHHPQLDRFKAQADPAGAIAAYLIAIAEEAALRGYHYNRALIGQPANPEIIPVTSGQLAWEWEHLKRKLERRDPRRLANYQEIGMPDPHPLFRVVEGGIEPWERGHLILVGAGNQP